MPIFSVPGCRMEYVNILTCMAFLKSLPQKSHLSDVFKSFPKGVKPLLEFHDAILRESSPLTVSQRELIAAYVSGLNGCQFCFGSHVRIASLHGIKPELFEDLLVSIESSSVDSKFKPILFYVKKLTLNPSRVTQADVDNILDAGWSEEAIVSVASTCALFNYMNRFVDGLGVSAETISAGRMKGDGHLSQTSYQDFGRMIGLL